MAHRVRQDWLDQVVEEVLEPELPILDPHHHLWIEQEHWGTYSKDDLVADLATGHNVVGTVFVDCRSEYRTDGPEALRPIGETEYIDGIANECEAAGAPSPGPCAGIVSHADMFLGDAVEEVLVAHEAASPRFRGIRHITAWDRYDDVRYPDPTLVEGMMGQAKFVEGCARLAKRGHSFDAWLFHPQIPELTALARALPDLQIVLDHLGGPLGIGPYAKQRDEVFAQWKRDVAELARCENVSVKLGGFVMDVNGFDWEARPKPPTSEELAAATRDYYLHAIDCFGPKRAMFESNFPVDRSATSYAVLWNSFKRIAEGFSAEEKGWLFRDAAARVYRLG